MNSLSKNQLVKVSLAKRESNVFINMETFNLFAGEKKFTLSLINDFKANTMSCYLTVGEQNPAIAYRNTIDKVSDDYTKNLKVLEKKVFDDTNEFSIVGQALGGIISLAQEKREHYNNSLQFLHHIELQKEKKR